MQIILFEDKEVQQLYPITLTRPAFDITCGGTNLYKLVKEYFQGRRLSYVVRDYLKKTVEGKYKNTKLQGQDFLFVNACLVPSIANIREIEKIIGNLCVILKNGERIVAAHVSGKVKAKAIDEIFGELNPKVKKTKIKLFSYPWDPIVANKEILSENIKYLSQGMRQYKKGVYLGKNAQVGENVVFDTCEGPIYIGGNTKIFPLVHLQGPVYIGTDCQIKTFADVKEGVSIADTCKVGGEVEASVIESYSNKQHSGFLGHSYVGSWVNLGANTTNSDLKNTYGTIKVEVGGRKIDTGLQFLGCVIGDYSKTGINTSILTGKMIGINCNVIGLVSDSIPSFTNYTPAGMIEYYLEEAIKVQKRMFARRKVRQTSGDKKLLNEVFRLTAPERRTRKVQRGRVRV